MNEIVHLRKVDPAIATPDPSPSFTPTPSFTIYQARADGLVAIDACVPLAVAIEMLRLLSSAI